MTINTLHLLMGEWTLTLEAMWRILQIPIEGDLVIRLQDELGKRCSDH